MKFLELASEFRHEVKLFARQNKYIQSKLIETICLDKKIDKVSIEGKRFISEEDCLKLEKQKYFSSLIGDFLTFAPKVCCNVNVDIEDYAFNETG